MDTKLHTKHLCVKETEVSRDQLQQPQGLPKSSQVVSKIFPWALEGVNNPPDI